MTEFSRRKFVLAGAATATVAIAGCGEMDDDDDEAMDDEVDVGDEDADPEERVDAYLTENDAREYDGEIEDLTGEDMVEVAVGAGDEGLAFEPAAMRIEPGTTIVWEWTGEGGAHNVAPDEESDIQEFGETEALDEAGHTVEDTIEEEGVGLYVCEPHIAQNMYGAFIVGGDEE